jgi:hypothetical protein
LRFGEFLHDKSLDLAICAHEVTSPTLVKGQGI